MLNNKALVTAVTSIGLITLFAANVAYSKSGQAFAVVNAQSIMLDVEKMTLNLKCVFGKANNPANANRYVGNMDKPGSFQFNNILICPEGHWGGHYLAQIIVTVATKGEEETTYKTKNYTYHPPSLKPRKDDTRGQRMRAGGPMTCTITKGNPTMECTFPSSWGKPPQ